MLACYVGAYFWLGEEYEVRWNVSELGDDGIAVHRDTLSGITRVFPQQWHVALFQPAAQVESWSRRIEVETMDMRSWVLTRDGTP